jgi:hypothetical protein
LASATSSPSGSPSSSRSDRASAKAGSATPRSSEAPISSVELLARRLSLRVVSPRSESSDSEPVVPAASKRVSRSDRPDRPDQTKGHSRVASNSRRRGPACIDIPLVPDDLPEIEAIENSPFTRSRGKRVEARERRRSRSSANSSRVPTLRRGSDSDASAWSAPD